MNRPFGESWRVQSVAGRLSTAAERKSSASACPKAARSGSPQRPVHMRVNRARATCRHKAQALVHHLPLPSVMSRHYGTRRQNILMYIRLVATDPGLSA